MGFFEIQKVKSVILIVKRWYFKNSLVFKLFFEKCVKTKVLISKICKEVWVLKLRFRGLFLVVLFLDIGANF